MGEPTNPVSNLGPGHDVRVGVVQQAVAQVLMLGEVMPEPPILRLQSAHLRPQADDVIRHLVHSRTIVFQLLEEI